MEEIVSVDCAVAVGVALFEGGAGLQADVAHEDVQIFVIDDAVEVEVGVGAERGEGIDFVHVDAARCAGGNWQRGAGEVQQRAASDGFELDWDALAVVTGEVDVAGNFECAFEAGEVESLVEVDRDCGGWAVLMGWNSRALTLMKDAWPERTGGVVVGGGVGVRRPS